MKTIWNQGLKRVKANKMSTVKTPPPNDTVIITVQNNAQTSSNVYPSLLSFFSRAQSPPFLPELNKETVCLHGAAQLSMDVGSRRA